MQFLDRRMLSQFDWLLLGLVLLLPTLGLVVLYSAGYASGSPSDTNWIPWLAVENPAFVRQTMFLILGLGALLTGALIPPQLIYRSAYWLYGLAVLALGVVLMLGQHVNGSRRWLSLGFANFQPSELMKLCLIIGLARYLSRNLPEEGAGYGFAQLLAPFMLFLAPMALIVRQPDLGTALCVGFIGFSLVLFVGIRLKSLLIMAGTGAGAVVPLYHLLLKSYQKRRLWALFNPDADPLGSGYHITQSKIAVGSGAVFGKGYLHGTQTQLEFLPEHTTDFVFSVLAEEWGFAGSVFVVVLYFYLLYRLLRVAARSKDLFGSLLVFGIAALIFFHVFVNIGMVVGILPVVGLPLPLFSYGGSSVLVIMFALGLALGVAMRRLSFVSSL